MEIPFIGGAYHGRSLNINAQVCQNLYPVVDQQGGKTVVALMNTPGLTLFSALTAGEVRGSCVMGDYLYATRGNTVYKVDNTGTSTAQAGVLLTATGPVWMYHNGTQVMIVDGLHGYILVAGTVTEIADADFPIPSSLAYQDGYFIVSKAASGRFYISASYDGTSWFATDYATAESDPDNLQVVISSQRELWLIGKVSYEVWYNSGNATFPFDRIQGAVNRIGCIAPHSAAEYQGMIAWLDNTLSVKAVQGSYQTQNISTPQIEYQIQQYTTVTDAIGFIYSQEGHTFYVLTFPTEGKTLVYDFTTTYWHTRASDSTDLRHRANCYSLFEKMHIVGDYSNGNLYKYDLGKYTDNGTCLRRIRAAQVVHSDRKTIFHNSLEIEFEAGVGGVANKAVAHCHLTAGVITSIDIDDGGTGYVTAPIITFSGGGGTGALATATIAGGIVTLITIDNGGSGYSSAPTITISGGKADPQAVLEWSDDGGHIWSNQHWTSIGQIGEYKNRARWKRLGRSRERIYKVTLTDDVKTVIIGAHLEAQVGSV